MPHQIRLRGPWEYTALGGDSAGHKKPQGAAQASGDWTAVLGAGFDGELRLTRRFHRPTGLDGSERVWLSVGSSPSIKATLNGQGLNQDAEPRVDVTLLLQPSNVLSLEGMMTADSVQRVLGQVMLEIE